MKCLLCEASRLRVVQQLTGMELRALLEALGHRLSDAALGQITPEYCIELQECETCGFHFFDPALAGAGQFYEELDQAVYYPGERAEYAFALGACVDHGVRRVLDVGGGDGAFLDLARGRGLETLGVELNTIAAAVAAAKGHRMLSKMLEEIAPADIGGEVDALTLFHVVEHVRAPCDFLRSAAALVRPGGLLITSVPNREGLIRLLPYDPANLPPHHVSRWRARDFTRLAKGTGLELLETRTETLYGSGIEGFWLQHNRLAAAIGRPPYPGGTWLPRLLSLLYRKLGCRHYLPLAGFGLFVVFRRPSV